MPRTWADQWSSINGDHWSPLIADHWSAYFLVPQHLMALMVVWWCWWFVAMMWCGWWWCWSSLRITITLDFARG